jgi:putative phosphoesterase
MRKAGTSGGFVGVISDTHGLVRPEAIEALRGARLILHGGDIGSPDVLRALERIAPVIAVRGNNDRDAWAKRIPEIVITDIGGARACVIHEITRLHVDLAKERIDVVVSGHSHRPSIDRRAALFLNPGSAGPRRFSLPVTIARLRVDARGIDAEIVPLGVAVTPRVVPRRARHGRTP